MTSAAPPARLLSSTGEGLDPEMLAWSARLLDADSVVRFRRRALADGFVFEREDHAVLGVGTAATLELPNGLGEVGASSALARLLAEIPMAADSSPDATGIAGGPVALGALPFWNDATARLVVPTITVIRGESRPPVAITVGPPCEVAANLFDQAIESLAADADSDPPDQFQLDSVRPHADFLARVEAAVSAIHHGELEKVVLVREVTVRANRPLRQRDLLGRLRTLHPSCTAFAIDGFFGASPELLCSRRGRIVRSRPLAGTVARSGDPEEDERLGAAMLADEKERAEHAFVVEAVRGVLAPHCEVLDVPSAPYLLELRNVAHLATAIEGRLRGETPVRILELVASLHPTPAVGGAPQAAALDYLAKYEDVERDRFAGPVGYVRADGDGEFWVGIRSAIVSGRSARLFAGVGIVADSDPRTELTETQLKLQALLAVAVRP